MFLKGPSHKIITAETVTTSGTPSTAWKPTTAMTPEMIKITVEQVGDVISRTGGRNRRATSHTRNVNSSENIDNCRVYSSTRDN